MDKKWLIPIAAILIVLGFLAVGNFSFNVLPPDCKFVTSLITTGSSGGIATCDSDRCISQIDLSTQLNSFRVTPWHVVIKQEISTPAYSVQSSCFNVGGDNGVPMQTYSATVQNDLVKGQQMVYTGFAYGGSCGTNSDILQVTRTNKITVSKYQCGQTVSSCGTEGNVQCSGNVAQICNSGYWRDTETCPSGTTCSAAGSAWACVGTVKCSDGAKIGDTKSCGTNGYQTCEWPGVYSTCKETTIPQVCGNNICEPPETVLNCGSDCVPSGGVLKEGEICNQNSQYKCNTGLTCDAPPFLNGICRKTTEIGCAAEGESTGGIAGILEKSCCDVAKDGKTPLFKNNAGICTKQTIFDQPSSVIFGLLIGLLAGVIAFIRAENSENSTRFALSGIVAATVGFAVYWVLEFIAKNWLILTLASVGGAGIIYVALGGLTGLIILIKALK